MKLIIAGATGFVGKELLRQGLRNPQVSSIVAISRGPVSAPDGANQSKLKSVVVKDYGTYTTEDRKEFTGAAACIWTVGVIPMKSPNIPFEEVRKICLDDTIASLNVMVDSNPMKPFRFLYMSGADSKRDQTKVPNFMPEYFLMRGETENRVLKFARKRPGQVEACIARPGLIGGAGGHSVDDSMTTNLAGMKTEVTVTTVAAALLHQALNGFEKDTLFNSELNRLGAL